MVRLILKSMMISAVGSLTYMMVFFLTFPAEDLRVFIMSKARQQGYDLRIGEVALSGIPAVSFDGLSVASMDKARRRGKGSDTTPEEASAHSPFLNVDGIDLALNPFPLFKFSAEDRLIDLDVESKLYGGAIDGRVALNQAHTVLDLKGSAIDLAKYKFQSDSMQVDARGLLSIIADLDLSSKDLKLSTGVFELKADNLAFTKATKVSGFELPVELNFSESILRMQMTDGRADIESFELIGDALSAEAEGYIQLNKSLPRSRVNIKVKFKLGEDLELFSALIPSAAKGNDGWIYYQIRGLLSSPNFRPDASKGRSTKTPPIKPLPHPTMDENEGDRLPRVGAGRPRPAKSPLRPAKGASQPKAKDVKARRKAATQANSSMTEEERERRREERRRLAEERRERREERLARIREAREGRGDGDEAGEMVPPMPGDGRLPFRPPSADDDDEEEEYDEGEEHYDDDDEEDEEEYDDDEQELPDPEIEIVRGDEDEEYYDDEEE